MKHIFLHLRRTPRESMVTEPLTTFQVPRWELRGQKEKGRHLHGISVPLPRVGGVMHTVKAAGYQELNRSPVCVGRNKPKPGDWLLKMGVEGRYGAS